MKRFICMLVGLMLCIAVPALAAKPMANEFELEFPVAATDKQIKAGLFIPGMTYEGDLNPADITNKKIYKAVAVRKSSRVLLVFCEAQVEGTPKYAAVTVYYDQRVVRVVAIAYYKDFAFHQAYVTNSADLTFELMKITSKAKSKQLQADFKKAFHVLLPLAVDAI